MSSSHHSKNWHVNIDYSFSSGSKVLFKYLMMLPANDGGLQDINFMTYYLEGIISEELSDSGVCF